MFIVKHTGLIPVVSLKRGGKPYGLSPADATKGILAGELQAVTPPEGIEATEVPDPVAAKPEAPVAKVADIEIPSDWSEQHPLKQIKWAMEITGQKIELTPEDEAADVKKTDKAAAIIREFLEQRAAA